MSTIAVSTLGAAPVAGAFTRAQPTVTALTPSGTVSTTPLNVTWTYTSPVGRAQVQYRIRLLSQDRSSVVYDTGILVGASPSASVVIALSTNSTYTVAVSAADLYDWSAESFLTVTFDGNNLSSITPLASVGTVYEVGINGVGYMLADHPDKEVRYSRRVVPLDPARLATGDTPFSESVERYTMIGRTDWSDGAGQRFYRRDTSSDRAYLSSVGINPFTAGQVTLLPSTAQFHASTYAGPQKAVIAGNKFYMVTATNQLTSYDDPSDTTATNFAVNAAPAGACVDLASDGNSWYYTDGANVYRGSTPASGAAWSTEDAQVIEWCTDRIVIAKKTGASTLPNALATLNYSTGAVSGPGAGSTPFTFEEETDIRSITSGNGYVWWGATRFDQSVIYSWQLGSTASYQVAWQVPAGQEVRTVGFYQGNLFIACTERAAVGNRTIIYRGVPQQGAVTVARVLEIDDGIDRSVIEFAGDDRFVYFSWRSVNTFSGIGCIDLSGGGWSKWSEAPGGTGAVRSVLSWYGRAMFTIDGYGAVLEQVPVGGDDKSVSTGTITFSVDDLNTSQRKRFTNVQANFDPLPAGASITISYSLDGGTSFTNLSPPVTGAGEKTANWTIDQQSDSVQVRAVLTKGSTTTPILRTVTVRANAIGLADQVLVLPISCFDQATDLRGRPLVENGPGKGAARARTVEQLVQTSVLVQDIDYQTSGSTQIYDVVACEISSIGVPDRKLDRQTQGMVAVLTLRRSLK